MRREDRRDSEALYNRMTISELKTNIPEPKSTDPIQVDRMIIIFNGCEVQIENYVTRINVTDSLGIKCLA